MSKEFISTEDVAKTNPNEAKGKEEKTKSKSPIGTVNLDGVKNKIMIMSGKGGVGKSTIAAYLASSLAKRGYRVGLLDSDIHGPSIPKMFGLENKKPEVDEKGIVPVPVSENLKVMSIAFLLEGEDFPVIWRGPAKMGAIKQFLQEVSWGVLDFLIIDLPPGTGDEPLSIAQLISDFDGAIVVTTPQDVALTSVRKSINFLDLVDVPVIGLVENMSGVICPSCGDEIEVFGGGGVEKAASDFGISVLAELPIEPQVSQKADTGATYSYEGNESEWDRRFSNVVDSIEKLENNTKNDGN
ncbi:ATPase-like, ParA/MinD [Methanohalobium evestigatum Z-7303]|uniref:Iron-sulfur cluster carrier protein n=1 Tax=Methanohalobium evestigatum (strain ATCC BAA-1072 / DSM 3721 / NBRC 107634 / OCM 161 / Z-7303) TaxID=644295 RepID=D7EBT6_METEZ|nr:Mrp/NBP35 family ATP-binding protein [Methanohalobium evestigatum]ADI74928.1 ATPase-like, ParA/MinD [Methanohalobium evestigatum Z-7303]